MTSTYIEIYIKSQIKYIFQTYSYIFLHLQINQEISQFSNQKCLIHLPVCGVPFHSLSLVQIHISIMVNASQKCKVSVFSANGPFAETKQWMKLSSAGLSRKPALILQHEWTRFHNAQWSRSSHHFLWKSSHKRKRDRAAVLLPVKSKLKR